MIVQNRKAFISDDGTDILIENSDGYYRLESTNSNGDFHPWNIEHSIERLRDIRDFLTEFLDELGE